MKQDSFRNRSNLVSEGIFNDQILIYSSNQYFSDFKVHHFEKQVYTVMIFFSGDKANPNQKPLYKSILGKALCNISLQ